MYSVFPFWAILQHILNTSLWHIDCNVKLFFFSLFFLKKHIRKSVSLAIFSIMIIYTHVAFHKTLFLRTCTKMTDKIPKLNFFEICKVFPVFYRSHIISLIRYFLRAPFHISFIKWYQNIVIICVKFLEIKTI